MKTEVSRKCPRSNQHLGCLSAASRLPLGSCILWSFPDLSAISRLSLGHLSAISRPSLGSISPKDVFDGRVVRGTLHRLAWEIN